MRKQSSGIRYVLRIAPNGNKWKPLNYEKLINQLISTSTTNRHLFIQIGGAMNQSLVLIEFIPGVMCYMETQNTERMIETVDNPEKMKQIETLVKQLQELIENE